MRVVVTGSHGMIGSALVASLHDTGHDVGRLVRGAPERPGDIRWDPTAGEIDAAALDGTDAVVHLAGAGIGDHRWTPDYKRKVLESRTVPTSLLARTLAGLSRPPSVLVSGSAIGFYGSRGDQVLTESSHAGDGYLAEIVQAWEAAAAPAEEAGIRVARIRTGLVLSPRGGALEPLRKIFRTGLGGRLGSGRQWWSWITLGDELRAIRWLLEHDVSGPVNLTAPNPVTNADFSKALGRALHRPAVVPVPRFGPELVLGRELAGELLFSSQRAVPAVLTEAGFTFEHTDLDAALQSVLA